MRSSKGEAFSVVTPQGVTTVQTAAPNPQPTDIRAGVIKVGVGYWSISPFERGVLESAAQAHVETGAPIVGHLEMGTAAWEVLELLSGSGCAVPGVRSRTVV